MSRELDRLLGRLADEKRLLWELSVFLDVPFRCHRCPDGRPRWQQPRPSPSEHASLRRRATHLLPKLHAGQTRRPRDRQLRLGPPGPPGRPIADRDAATVSGMVPNRRIRCPRGCGLQDREHVTRLRQRVASWNMAEGQIADSARHIRAERRAKTGNAKTGNAAMQKRAMLCAQV